MPDLAPEPPEEMGELRFKAEALERLGLPDIGYPICIEAFTDAITNDGEMPFAEMLFGLQAKSRSGQCDWRSLEPAIARLAELIAPDDERAVVDVAGDTWWLEIGPVDLNGPIVTIQRQDTLIAAICPRGDGRLRVACYRPLDAKSANYLIGLALNPYEGRVCMRVIDSTRLVFNSMAPRLTAVANQQIAQELALPMRECQIAGRTALAPPA